MASRLARILIVGCSFFIRSSLLESWGEPTIDKMFRSRSLYRRLKKARHCGICRHRRVTLGENNNANGHDTPGLVRAGLLLVVLGHGIGCAGLQKPALSPGLELPVPAGEAERISGSWKAEDEAGYFVRFEGERYTVAYSGRVRSVAKILAVEGSRIRLCDRGRERLLETAFQGNDLLVTDSDSKVSHRLERLLTSPPELRLEPLRLPKTEPLPAQQVVEAQRELWESFQVDGNVQKKVFGGIVPIDPEPWRRPLPPAAVSEDSLRWIETTTHNTELIKNLVTKVGWIDAGRFGYAAAKAAVLIVQHGRDLPLALAALPEVRRDVEGGRLEGEIYAILYDRLQLALGEKQRYGSQIGTDDHGAPVVLPVDDPTRVEELRKSMGMVPLTQYLRLFGAEEVRFSTACSAGS
jgi:hypothetical protein